MVNIARRSGLRRAAENRGFVSPLVGNVIGWGRNVDQRLRALKLSLTFTQDKKRGQKALGPRYVGAIASGFSFAA